MVNGLHGVREGLAFTATMVRLVPFAARRGLRDAAHWRARFGRVAHVGRVDPTGATTLADPNRRHDLRACSLALYAATREGGDVRLAERVRPGVRDALRGGW